LEIEAQMIRDSGKLLINYIKSHLNLKTPLQMEEFSQLKLSGSTNNNTRYEKKKGRINV
jgi:hypothetical protein